jgi:hypothetical protein
MAHYDSLSGLQTSNSSDRKASLPQLTHCYQHRKRSDYCHKVLCIKPITTEISISKTQKYSNSKTNVNPLTPELNPTAQRSLTRFFTGDFASWGVYFVNICVKYQQIHQLLIHVTRNNTLIHNILSTALQLSISQKALGTLPEDGNVMSKHVGATIHN